MDFEVLKIFATGIAFPFGFYLLNRVSGLAKELETHKLYAANTYLKKDEVQEMRKELRESMAELKKDLHKKIDELKDLNKV